MTTTMTMPRRQKGGYFPAETDAPAPLVVRLKQRIHFSDVDPMGILWHGRYAKLFEKANEALGRLTCMTYADYYRDKIKAPIVQFHVDYFAPARLSEEITIVGKMVWSDGARVNIEYEIRNEDGRLAATGYTVQMFIDDEGIPLIASPDMLDACRQRWLRGELNPEGAAR
jgi:acyl-CoA thioester hydrolase